MVTSRAVLRPLEATRVDRMLALYPTVDEAVDRAALSPAPLDNDTGEDLDQADCDR